MLSLVVSVSVSLTNLLDFKKKSSGQVSCDSASSCSGEENGGAKGNALALELSHHGCQLGPWRTSKHADKQTRGREGGFRVKK